MFGMPGARCWVDDRNKCCSLLIWNDPHAGSGRLIVGVYHTKHPYFTLTDSTYMGPLFVVEHGLNWFQRWTHRLRWSWLVFFSSGWNSIDVDPLPDQFLRPQLNGVCETPNLTSRKQFVSWQPRQTFLLSFIRYSCCCSQNICYICCICVEDVVQIRELLFINYHTVPHDFFSQPAHLCSQLLVFDAFW